jgi:uncharacterized protein (DUF433 family)
LEEKMADFKERVVVDPEIMLGKPVIKGTRIPIYLILDLLAAKRTYSQIIDDYPELTEEDIKSAIEYASSVTQYEEVKIASD